MSKDKSTTIDTPEFRELAGGVMDMDALIAYIDAYVATQLTPMRRHNLELSRVNHEQRLQEGRLEVALQRYAVTEERYRWYRDQVIAGLRYRVSEAEFDALIDSKLSGQ